MRAAVRRSAVAMLRRLRRLVAKDANASLGDVEGDRTGEAFVAAFTALNNAGFYNVTARPNVVRDVDRAIRALEGKS